MLFHGPVSRRAAAVGVAAGLWLAMMLTGAPSSSSAPGDGRIEDRLYEELAARGTATFWVHLRERADLTAASFLWDWDEQGGAVLAELTETADRTQRGLRALLARGGVPFQPFWISNVIQVTGDLVLAEDIAARPEVESLTASRTYLIPALAPAEEQARIDAIEWNIDRINAPDVWDEFGARGQRIVVANIDTGVLFTHEALAHQYRGWRPDGSFDHDYNWYDPSRVCPDPQTPCDNDTHGTFTMGVMVGDDGRNNRIGVAPGARWIAAKGCEALTCSEFALLASAQWILAPTRVDGTEPSPHERPHVVNNSWGGEPGDRWYMDAVDAWIAAGIFPAFSVGNSGRACGSAGSPGDYPQAYAAGAFDINDVIAPWSSRGPSAFGLVKPDIAAPGVDIRTSRNNGKYATISGTSLASPHVAGTVALILSDVPDLIGNIDGLRRALDQTAIDRPGTCGGRDGNNNTWGEGALDAFAAVDLANG